MRNPSLDSTISAALRSLTLIEDGWSERGAMRRATKSNPNATNRRDTFSLVMVALQRKSLVDRAIEMVLGRTPTDKGRLALARLAVVLSFQSAKIDQFEALDALRKNCPMGFRPRLEKLFGDLTVNRGLDYYLDGLSQSERIALLLGFPDWWVEYCAHVWGRAEMLQILGGETGPRPRYVHLNPLRSDRISQGELLSLQGLEPLDSLQGFFRVTSEGLSGPVRECVEKGILEGQDLASYLAVVAGTPNETDTVLDVCAAPGGKTGALSQLMGNRGMIVSADYSLGRMRDWKRMVNTLGASNASGVVEDATRPAFKQPVFDLILVDPPCSGSGIFSKNPAMKWHLSPQRQARYAELQYRLLNESSKFLKRNGRIVYSTCSISLEENEGVVSRFLVTNPDFETRPILDGWGHPGLRGFGNCRRFYPHLDATSGYFIARLERIC